MVFSRVEIWWNVDHKHGETPIWKVCHRWWYGLWHRRIEPYSKITYILDQSEWPIAKDVGPFSRRFHARQKQTFYDLVNVYVFDIGSICIHGKELLRQFTFHQKIQGKISLKSKCSRYLNSWYWNNQMRFFGVSNQLGKFFMETNSNLWSMMKKSSVSRMQKSLCTLRFCVMSWKDESEPNIKYCLGATVGLVQRFITIQNFVNNWRRPMEFEWNISQDSLHCSSSKKSNSSWAKWANPNNSKDELSSCRCSMASYGEVKSMKRQLLLLPH